MSHLTLNFLLTGKLKGKTLKLGKYHFQDGKTTVTASAVDMELHKRSLERNWSAYPEGDPRHGLSETSSDQKPDGQPPVSGDVQQDGSGPEAGGQANVGAANASADAGGQALSADGAGSPASVTPPNEKLARAIAQLDPANDEHWNKDGRPALTAVAALYGSQDVTRADVDAAAPGFKRPAST